MMMPPPFDTGSGQEEATERLTWREWCLALVVAAFALGALVFGPTAGT